MSEFLKDCHVQVHEQDLQFAIFEIEAATKVNQENGKSVDSEIALVEKLKSYLK